MPSSSLRWLLLAASCLALFLLAWIGVRQGSFTHADDMLGHNLRDGVDHASWGLSWLVHRVENVVHGPLRLTFTLTAAAALLLGLLRRWWSLWLLLLTASGGILLAAGARQLIVRPPPHMYGTHSFPSGHAVVAAALLGILVYVLWHETGQAGVASVAGLLAGVLAVLVGLQRVAADDRGVHYVSDVLGGYLLGATWLALVIAVFTALRCPAAQHAARGDWTQGRPRRQRKREQSSS